MQNQGIGGFPAPSAGAFVMPGAGKVLPGIQGFPATSMFEVKKKGSAFVSSKPGPAAWVLTPGQVGGFTLSSNTAVTPNSNINTSIWYGLQTRKAAYTGRFYYELTCTSTEGNHFQFGLATAGAAEAWPGATFGVQDSSMLIYAGSAHSLSTGLVFNAGNVAGVAVDVDRKRAWVSVGGSWGTGGSPTAGAGLDISAAWAVGFGAPLSPAFAYQDQANGNGSFNANFGSSAFSFGPPAGFQPWDNA